MAQKIWTVRVVQQGNPDHSLYKRDSLPGLWMEQLRKLGYVNILKEWDGTDEGTEVIEFLPFKGVDSKTWADMNAERMQSFGINAVAAPMWTNGAFTFPLEAR